MVLGSLCMALFAVAATTTVLATTATSPNYEASETEFGAGAALEACSGQYCASATIGAIGGESSSEHFSAAFSTPAEGDEEPLLELMVEPGEAHLGQLGTDRTATRTMLLHVNSYLAGGYTLQVTGVPPHFNDYTLASPLQPTASSKGSEQFAINAVANTDPEIGTDPTSISDSTTVPGVVLPNYGMPNKFMYINGDTVARSTTESSKIRYTISMIVNVAGTTPAGHYAGDFSAMVTPDF